MEKHTHRIFTYQRQFTLFSQETYSFYFADVTQKSALLNSNSIWKQWAPIGKEFGQIVLLFTNRKSANWQGCSVKLCYCLQTVKAPIRKEFGQIVLLFTKRVCVGQRLMTVVVDLETYF